MPLKKATPPEDFGSIVSGTVVPPMRRATGYDSAATVPRRPRQLRRSRRPRKPRRPRQIRRSRRSRQPRRPRRPRQRAEAFYFLLSEARVATAQKAGSNGPESARRATWRYFRAGATASSLVLDPPDTAPCAIDIQNGALLSIRLIYSPLDSNDISLLELKK
jgi:hypothetical protein